jgi:hypothetical protein
MKTQFLTLLAVAFLSFFAIAQEPQKDAIVNPKVKSSADVLIVRDLDGNEKCRFKYGDKFDLDGIAEDRERVRIATNSGTCAGVQNGFVYLNYLRPTNSKVDRSTDVATVSVDDLSLRTRPTIAEGSFACALPKNLQVTVLPNEVQKKVRWVEVELKEEREGCPKKGWVSSSYLKPDIDISQLPLVTDLKETQAKALLDCTVCTNSPVDVSDSNKPKLSVTELQNYLRNQQAVSSGLPNPFLDFVRELGQSNKCPSSSESTYVCSRGLVQMPSDGEVGFCGSHHYSPGKYKGKVADNYAAPHTACALVALAQEWKKNHCTDENGGCKLAWGDISHVKHSIFNGHKSHTRGECIDIRPFNTGAFEDRGRYVSDPAYDRATTAKFLKLAKSMGGEIMYSDRKMIGDSKLQAE